VDETPLILVLGPDESPRAALTASGFEVTTSEASRPAAVLLDLDDVEQPYPRIAEVRAQFPEAAVIARSRHDEPRHVVEAVRSGAQDFVAADVSPQELREVIDQALLRQRLSLEQRGVVQFLEDRGRQVADEKRALHERMAAMAAELERAHRRLEDAHRELRGRVAQLTMLYRIGRDLTTHRNWDEALQAFLASLCKFLDARGATLLLRSQGGSRLAARSTVGMENEAVERAIDVLRPQVRAEGAEPLLVPLGGSTSTSPRPCTQMESPWSHTVLPLWHHDEDLGSLVIEKDYADAAGIQEDFYFLITIQTVLAEEVASAQAFTQLRRLQQFQERTLDRLGSGIVTVDEDGKISSANAKARAMLGRRSRGRDGTRRALCTWAAKVRISRVGSRASRTVPPPRSKVGCRASARTNRRRCRWWRRIFPASSPGDAARVLVIEDLSQKRALESERRRAARQKELLIMAAEWAHDVRTPLTGILHSAELLAGAVDPRSPKLRHFRVIQSEVGRINGLVDHFLDYARPVRLRRAQGDLAAVVREVVDLLEGPATTRGIDLRFVDAQPGLECTCRLDRDAVKQVILNLVSNALDASGDGTVTVRLERRDDASLDEDGRRGRGAIVQVEDDGPGVPAEFVDRLFVPFFTTKPDGTGLGLAISEKIVRAHDGDLRYLREHDRTILRATFPRDAIAAPADVTDETTDSVSSLHSKG
jgi:signal transduction histidine kinase/DNA-binding response OmpR family regulator